MVVTYNYGHLFGRPERDPELLPITCPAASRVPKSRRSSAKTVFSYAASFALFCIVFVSPIIYIGMHPPHEQANEAAKATGLAAITLESIPVQKVFPKQRSVCEFSNCDADLAKSDDLKDDEEIAVAVAVAVGEPVLDSEPVATKTFNQRRNAGNLDDLDPTEKKDFVDPFYPTSPENIVPTVPIPTPVTSPTVNSTTAPSQSRCVPIN